MASRHHHCFLRLIPSCPALLSSQFRQDQAAKQKELDREKAQWHQHVGVGEGGGGQGGGTESREPGRQSLGRVGRPIHRECDLPGLLNVGHQHCWHLLQNLQSIRTCNSHPLQHVCCPSVPPPSSPR
jgi:hypothetical protein